MKIKDLPKKIPVFPLSNFIIFPKTTVPLNIFETRYLYMFKIKKIPYKPDKLIGLKDFVTIKLNQIYYSNSVFYIKI